MTHSDRRVVVFDLGIVLSTPSRLYENLAAILKTTPGAVEEAFWVHRHAYDEGSSDREFWGATLPLVAGARGELDDVLDALVAVDTDGWAHPREEARRILSDLRGIGQRTAILSNAPSSFAAASTSFDWYDLVPTWVFSGPLGVAKPDPRIYEAVEQQFTDGDEFWFVDDKPVNVDAANERGWHAHLWVNDTDTRAWLVGEGFLDS